MAHEIEENYAFFASSTPAWHGLGKVLKDAPSIEEAWQLAYPFTLHMTDLEATIKDENGEKQYIPVPEIKAVFRSDGKYIGNVGAGYEMIQPATILDRGFRSWIETGLVDLEAGGSLREGKRFWALAKIKDSETKIIGNDTVKAYLLMFTGFDGSLRLGVSKTNTRVVCANTLAAAQDEGIDYRFKHTKNVLTKMDNAVEQIKESLLEFKKDVEAYRYLAQKKVSESAQKAYVRRVILGDEIANDPKADIATRTQNTIEDIIGKFDTQRGLELVPAIRGTAWQAYNAVSEYYTHDYGRTAENRVDSQFFGVAGTKNANALQMAMAM